MIDNYITKLESKTIISLSGKDAETFLQNVITNDITQLKSEKAIYSALLNPQGKLSNHFILFKIDNKIHLLVDDSLKNDLITKINLYKLRMEVVVKLESNLNCIFFKNTNKINLDKQIIFKDPRIKQLGNYLICSEDHIKNLCSDKNFKFNKQDHYYELLNNFGMVDECLKNLKEKYFSLECNLKELNAISFDKGCYIGQENTARMNLKDKISRRLFKIETKDLLTLDENIFYEEQIVGKVVSETPAFGIFKMEKFKNYADNMLITSSDKKLKLIRQNWLNI